ncbi:MAG: protein phosphatase 1 regulatory subunit 42 [Saprospiraceae bacterium]|nr:protein phosphatase 1 regulatory subunit 42 [Saprospiraceae bacterium]
MESKSILFIAVSSLLFLFVSPLHGQIDTNREIWFTDLTKAFENPLRVYNLDLSNNKLDSIPAYLSRFKNLEALKLSDNNIGAINDQLKQLKKLKFLELSGNRIRTINFAQLAPLKYSLEELWLRDNEIRSLDASIEYLSSLTRLDLGQNKITTIDSNITLKYLEVLTLDNNYISEFPAMIQNAPKLKILNLNSNNLTAFHFTTSQRNLRELNIGNNPIEKLQVDATKYKLEVLIMDWIDLQQQDLSFLPSSLRILSIEHCNLDAIPEEIFQLRYLEELSLIQNELTKLPAELLELRRLDKIWIGGNPIISDSLKQFTDQKRKVEVLW